MYYYTIKQNRKPIQLKFEDVLFGTANITNWTGESDKTGTITRCIDKIPQELSEKVSTDRLIAWLNEFNKRNQELFEANRRSLYRHYKIPKKTGGWRPIDEPCDKLQSALGELADFLKNDCDVLYHTAAFAYIDGRCTIDAVRKHAGFKSNWYLKTDVSGFFPNTTLTFTMNMLSKIFPLCEIMKRKDGKAALTQAISLGFLDSGLPQGTKLSPVLTSIIMIPIDYKLFGILSRRKMVYTRYADDMHISAREHFPYKEIVKIIEDTFKEFGAPYRIKDEKTHFGSVAGKNWCLGLMSNRDYKVTVGYRVKKHFNAALCNFILDTKNGNYWDIDDVQHLYGQLSYYRMIEKKYFNDLIRRANKKWNVNAEKMMKSYLKIA